jgi:hypothetical protein
MWCIRSRVNRVSENYLIDSQSEHLRQRPISAVERARQASLDSIALADDYIGLEESVEEWNQAPHNKHVA